MAQQEQEMLLTYRETKAKLAMLEAKERRLRVRAEGADRGVP